MSDSAVMVEISRIYLAIFFTFVALFYTVRIVLKKRIEQREQVFPGPKYCATWWNHMLFRGFRAAIWIACLVRLLFPQADTFLLVWTHEGVAPFILIGLLLLTFGFVLTLYVHFTMGRGWRSGIDPNQTSTLLTQGVFRLSRNPMYVGVAISQIGFLLALPSLFSLICLIVGLSVLQRQIIAEEKCLSVQHPAQYQIYNQQVRRWL